MKSSKLVYLVNQIKKWGMFSHHEKFKNISEGIKHLIIAIAIVIGGTWTLITFIQLKEREFAEAELEKIREEIFDNTAAEINIESVQTSSIDSNGYGILIEIKIKNLGKKHVTLTFEDKDFEPLQVGKIESIHKGNLKFSKVYFPKYYGTISEKRSEVQLLSSQTIQPGTTKTLKYFQQVDDKGIYLVKFIVKVQNDIVDDWINTDDSFPNKRRANANVNMWNATDFIQIQ